MSVVEQVNRRRVHPRSGPDAATSADNPARRRNQDRRGALIYLRATAKRCQAAGVNARVAAARFLVSRTRTWLRAEATSTQLLALPPL